MKYQVMFGTVPICCETASQALALAKEIAVSNGRTRAHGATHDNADDARLVSAISSLGPGGRRFVTALTQHPDGLSIEQFASALGFKKPNDMEGALSAIKGSLKRRGVLFSEVFEETSQGGRRFKIRGRVLNLVKKALESE